MNRAGAETSCRVEGDRMRRCATGKPSAAVSIASPDGIAEWGTYARVAQEPWDGVSALLSRTGTELQEKSSGPGVERSERAVGAVTWGNPLQGTPRSKGARRRTDSLEGEDDRVTELAGHLNQARTNSEAGEGDPGRHPHAGALHRRGLATRGLSPHAEGRCPRHRRTERGSVRGAP